MHKEACCHKEMISLTSHGIEVITQSLCNHMETASHLSFIKPFIAVIAEGALFYELLSNLAVHLYILQPHSSKLS